MNVYAIITRNNRGETRVSQLVLDEDQRHALGTASANNMNPFWPVVGIRAGTLQNFWDECSKHDWYHMMSDDHRVHKAGERDRARLNAIAEVLGADAQRLLAAWDPESLPERPE